MKHQSFEILQSHSGQWLVQPVHGRGPARTFDSKLEADMYISAMNCEVIPSSTEADTVYSRDSLDASSLESDHRADGMQNPSILTGDPAIACQRTRRQKRFLGRKGEGKTSIFRDSKLRDSNSLLPVLLIILVAAGFAPFFPLATLTISMLLILALAFYSILQDVVAD